MRLKEINLTLEKGNLLSFIYVLPALLIVLFVQVIPIFYGIFISFFNYDLSRLNITRDFTGLDNYARMIGDSSVWRALFNVIAFTVMAIGGDVLIGTAVSLVLHSISFGVSRILRPIITVPLLVSPIIVGLVWRYMLDPLSGIVYWFLGFFGIDSTIFPGIAGASTALLCVAMAHWWQVAPFVIIVVSAGLVSIPVEYYEAGRIDGANFIQMFFKVTLPHLRNIYMVVMVTAGVDTLKVYDIVFSMTGGGPFDSTLSLTMYAFRRAFVRPEMGYAMAISCLSMAVSFLIFGIAFSRYNQREAREY
ncbi:MAG: sugar ABC transporter permease [Treponema sp.]|nr:sugar ABC transporter permease [Treponema sp.]